MIEDEYVSQRMDRLAELTHNIFAYVEENPGKESRIRQFRQHYGYSPSQAREAGNRAHSSERNTL